MHWNELSQTTRPLLFQRIREAVTARQQQGEAVLLYNELEQQLREALPEEFEPAAVNTVVDQLAMQGVITNTRLASGERVLVLQVSHIECYASSLIVAARNNPRGVPVLEVAEINSLKSLPGISEAERLHPFQERIVLECVIQLLLEHGICLKHEGLLIFPALFPAAVEEERANIAQTVLLYYDFSGAVDNIISELIERFKITAARCVIVPGNHDLSWEQEVYDWRPQRKVDLSKLLTGSHVKQGDGYLIRDDNKYPSRFENFGKFYHELIQQPYPLKFARPCSRRADGSDWLSASYAQNPCDWRGIVWRSHQATT